MNFTHRDQLEMVDFYSQEKLRLAASLKHVEKMLRKLSGGESKSGSELVVTKTGEFAKKRGPKSVWGKFVLDCLTEHNRPMSYKELIDLGMAYKKWPASRLTEVRASILNSAFRLRSIQGKIQTVGIDGKKEKYLILTEWLNESGKMSVNHEKAFEKIAGGMPTVVDMSTIPSLKYVGE